MKKFLMIAAMALMSTGAFAQFQTFYLQYSPSSMKYSHDSYSVSTSYNQLALGYSYAMPLMDAIPLSIEFGGRVEWAFKSEDGVKSNLVAAKIPVNAVYSFQITDAFSIMPYAGPFFRFNILGKTKDEHGSHSETIDWFSDGDAKRFQIGLAAGARFCFNDKFFAGVGYSYDLMKIQDYTHFEGVEITAGLMF